MSYSPEETKKKLDDVVRALETHAPAAVFSGMTLSQFEAKLKQSYDGRAMIIEGDQKTATDTNLRDDGDVESLKQLGLIVNAIKGDPAYGGNSDLYEAMGYVRKSERKTGLPLQEEVEAGRHSA